ncbi:MAG: hypothetical protein JJE04_16155 [Acidobacteriia bacterium]|nr:hypothetical protein [Terriglobia bacterium]
MRSLLVASALLALAGCARQDTGNIRIDSKLTALVPPGALSLAGGRMDDLRRTPLYEKFVAGRKIPMLERFAAETGLDPRKDVQEFLIVSDGKRSIAIVRGKFRKSDLEKKLIAAGAKTAAHHGHTLLGEGGNVVAFMDEEIVVAGSDAAVRAVLDQRGSQARPPALPDVLARQLATIPSRPHLWAITSGGLPPLPVPDVGNLGNLNRVYASLESAVFWADMSSGMKLNVSAQCAEEAGAKQIYGALRALAGLGRLSTPADKQELLKFYDGIDIQQQGRSLRLTADLPIDVVDTLIQMFPAAAAQRSPSVR